MSATVLSASSIALSAYIAAFSEGNTQQQLLQPANQNNEVTLSYQDSDISFSYRQWQVVDASICATYAQDSDEFGQCSVNAKFVFKQICTALTNRLNNQVWQQQYQAMYCDAAVNYQPVDKTIAYGERRHISAQEVECNQLILKVLTAPTQELIIERDETCKGIK